MNEEKELELEELITEEFDEPEFAGDVSEDSEEGYWSDAVNTDEMKAFIKKNYHISYKYILILLLFLGFAFFTFITGNQEQSSLALALPGLTGDIKDALFNIAIFFAMFLVIMIRSNRKDVKPIEGRIESIGIGAAPDPEGIRTIIGRPRIPRYDIRLKDAEGKIHIMDTTDKRLADMYHPGDLCRYHEAFQYIEKYHKSDKDVIICPNCKKKFSEEVAICGSCKCPILR